ncbi:hypothetical protein KAR91_70765 [Candidatus Pacearchaeota archaeon]|nr:hypothetical protein [Candidatus Pacearchaeota archaeon]
MKKHKVKIPKGYRVCAVCSESFENIGGDPDNKTIEMTITFKPIKKELPKTWDEYCGLYKLYGSATLMIDDGEQYAAEFIALYQLIKLRDNYNDGWGPNWKNEDIKYHIFYRNDKIVTGESRYENKALSFKSKKLRDEFHLNFHDLLEIAKPLL